MKKVTFSSGDYVVFKKENNKNKILFFDYHGRNLGHADNIDKNFGNYWYKEAHRWYLGFVDYMDAFWFDLLAFENDYDGYSDYYKDVYGVRPHYTDEEWKAIVIYVKKRKP